MSDKIIIFVDFKTSKREWNSYQNIAVVICHPN
jgi:hypothetical protein